MTFKIIKPIPVTRIFRGVDLFHLKSTHGLPLVISVGLAMDRKCWIEWPGYFDMMRRHGAKMSNAIMEARNACIDVGYTFRQYIQPTFPEYVEEVKE
jgi:alanyl-tRNA synthetase